MEYVLEMKDISKTFPGVKALDHVQLQVKPGEVHALMGENGAGKSTLMKILMGIYTKDNGGEIIFNGQPYHVSNPKEAMDHGVAMIHQELNPILDMSVYENIFVGREIRKNGLVDAKAEIAEAEKLIKECGLHVSPKENLRNLTVAQCQLIEIIKAISINAKVIVMDEPTAAITDREVELLFEHIRSLTAKGVAIIYISHRMDEIFSICDRVSVYRDGQYIGSGDTKDLDEAQLIKMMVGREITDVFPKLEAEIGDVVFEAKNIVRADNKVKGVSLSVRRGEILGIGGLVGAGRSELVEGIFGMHELASGEIFVKGKQVKVHSPKDIIKEGVALITEDRKVTGLNLSGSVNDNIAMVAIKKLNIKTPSGDQITGNLSGGNQQKIVIAKWLLNDPDIIILDEPTRGIDVGAKRDIYLLLGKLVQQGKCEGNLSGEVQRDAFSQERIMTLASAIEV
ncbi:MAG: sugar ABC transporter ATP-binding protein [Butyricicoccus pullicaecorum]|nr:sugar ABC transporter ATP-binding protein [Butyricicoccus pullicaecorum]